LTASSGESHWKPDRFLKAILIWIMLTLIIVWLPLVRGLMDGDSYQWGNSFWGMQIGGSGVGGDYWLLAVQARLGIAVLYFGWRGAQQPFHWLVLLWLIPLAVQAAITLSLRLKTTGFMVTRSAWMSL
jgi:hypothetical protein